ncbi:MAG: hypothetical protein ABI155_14675 [Paralcaligenes sp.]
MLRRIALDFTTDANLKRRVHAVVKLAVQHNAKIFDICMHEVNKSSQSISVGRQATLKP